MQAEATEVTSPPESGEGTGNGEWGISGAPSASAAAAVAAAAGGPPAANEARGPLTDSLRLSYYACTAPESRFLRHFFGAVSLVRDAKGL